MIDIRVVPLTGEIIHGHEEHGHDRAGFELIGAGSDAIGALSYSLLRGQAINMRRFRAERFDSILSELEELGEEWKRIARVDEDEAERLHRQRAKLYLWDLAREVGEVCEQLAVAFTAIRKWDESRVDIASTMVPWQGSAYDVFVSDEFTEIGWWHRVLGTEPRPDRIAAITSAQAAIITGLLGSSAARVPADIQTVTSTYTPELHRVLIRRKHLAPLMDSDWGIVFPSEDAELATWVRTEVRNGALVLVDHKVVPKQIVQIVIPTTEQTLDALVALWRAATWLAESLVGSILGVAEHPESVPITFTEFEGDLPEVARAVYAYGGSSEAMTEADLVVHERSRAIEHAAHHTTIGMGRQERRAAERAARKRR